MIQYERIEVSEGIDLNKSNKSKECMIFQFGNFMILNIKGVNCRCFCV